MIADTFRDSESFLKRTKEYLNDKTAKGFDGNMIALDFFDDKVKITNQYITDDDPDYYFIISKKDLVSIIDQYIKIIQDPPEGFYLKQYDDGRITIELGP